MAEDKASVEEAASAKAAEETGLPELTPANEDYLEAIVILEQSKETDMIRSVDVAKLLDVSKASVNKALSALRAAGCIEQERYGRVALTELGRSYGNKVWARHQTLRRFLIDDLGVEPTLANEEACRMEHSVTQGTIEKLKAFLEREHGANKVDEEKAASEAVRHGVTVKFEK